MASDLEKSVDPSPVARAARDAARAPFAGLCDDGFNLPQRPGVEGLFARPAAHGNSRDPGKRPGPQTDYNRGNETGRNNLGAEARRKRPGAHAAATRPHG